jgi:hypothetical protein
VVDELTPIAVYMAQQMNTNAHGPDCQRIAMLNATSSRQCVADYFAASWWRRLFGALSPQQCIDIEISSHQAALMMWTMKVMQDAEWDHKPQIRVRFPSPTTHTGVWHTYDATEYFYDIWSNIHYGYVGTAAGFDEDVLLDGAGLEQIGTDLLRRRWPMRTRSVKGLRAFDDPSDRIAISTGIELYGMVPGHISARELVETILMTDGFDTREHPNP